MRRHDIKLRRLESEYQKHISHDLLLRMDRLPFDPNGITITKVEIDKEMTEAKVFFSSLEKVNKRNLVSALNRCRNIFIRSIRDAISVRYYPKIEFIYDDKEEKVTRVLEILEKKTEKKGEVDEKES